MSISTKTKEKNHLNSTNPLILLYTPPHFVDILRTATIIIF